MNAGARALQNKLSVFITLDEADRKTLDRLVSGRQQQIGRSTDMVSQGERRAQGYVLLDGWAARYKTLPDGRRQILSFLIPGDIVGLFAPISPYATASVSAVTHVTVSTFSADALTGVLAGSPRLGAALAWAAAREHEILAEHLVSVGRRTARERIAHLFLELWARLRARGLANGQGLSIPLTQAVIADTLGLSVVHVNRTLRRLAHDGILETRRDVADIRDLERLQQVAGFDEDFLLHHYVPRELRERLDLVSQGNGRAPMDGKRVGSNGQPRV